MHLKDYFFDHGWTLFLDRDGVINERLPGDYVKTPDEFRLIEGVPEAIAAFSRVFGHIFIVTNQQGIGKGLMTEEDLHRVHERMMDAVREAGGRIDAIYFAPQLEEEKSRMRKPGVGMAMQAKQDFPEIDLQKCVMVGDGLLDMEFGRKLGMLCVYISGEAASGKTIWDAQFESIAAFAKNCFELT